MKTLSSGTDEIYADRDYEIQASLTDPFINGVLIEGQILKIPLPSTDSDFDFGGALWANYLIEIYTPAKSVGNGLDVYYEFGERYMIGDAGLETRFHQGMYQNQSTDLVIPATFEFVQGDNYFAQRTLNMGNVIKYSFPSQTVEETGVSWFTGMDLISSYDVQDYIVGEQTYSEFVPGPPVVYFIKVVNGEFTFNFAGSISVRINSSVDILTSISVNVVAVDETGFGLYSTTIGTVAGPLVDDQLMVIPLEGTITRDDTDGGYLNLSIVFTFDAGPASDVSYTVVSGYLTISEVGNQFTVGLQNPNFSFFYESAVNSNGRPWVVNPDGRQSYNMALMRYGGAYQQDTNINSVNRFYSSNLDEFDRSKGDIRRFVFRQRILRVFQSAGVGQVGVYAQFITNSNGATQLIYTTNIITANNIQYYVGEHGMGAQNSGLISNRNADVFPDPVTGEIIRVSNDGMTSLTDLYKGQYYISSLITPYNFEWDRPDGSKAKILGAYDFLEEQYTFVLQSGSRNDGSGTITIDSYAFSFNEKRNAFCSFYDFNDAESILAGENILYSFLNGQVYQHNNSNAYANFYGLQYAPEITIDFNGGEAAKKTFAALSYQSNGVWTAPDIGTQVEQNSKLVAANFKKLEGFYHAAFLRDLNVRGGWINGPTLKGGWLTIRLVGPATGSYYYLSAISVKSIPSQLNNE